MVTLQPYCSYVLEGFNFNGVKKAQSLEQVGNSKYDGKYQQYTGCIVKPVPPVPAPCRAPVQKRPMPD